MQYYWRPMKCGVQRGSKPAHGDVRERHEGRRQREDLGRSVEPLLEQHGTHREIQTAESSYPDTTCLAYSQVKTPVNPFHSFCS